MIYKHVIIDDFFLYRNCVVYIDDSGIVIKMNDKTVFDIQYADIHFVKLAPMFKNSIKLRFYDNGKVHSFRFAAKNKKETQEMFSEILKEFQKSK